MQPFTPHQLPIKDLNFRQLIPLAGKANRFVARYDGILRAVVSPELLISPLRNKEAVLSSKIEGTRATFEDIASFDGKRKLPETDKDDLEEVLNYRTALLAGKEEMEKLPLTLNVIRTIHSVLMNGVRGQNSDRGNFRRIQNWIGPPGSTLKAASHVPPSPPVMLEALYDWEKYLHTEDEDVMIQLAIMHAQFEVIHPFLDGNGRLGRILIPLFLYHKEVIHQPFFYMSDYLEANRAEYYHRLQAISKNGDWNGWITFFLNGVVEQAQKTVGQAKSTLDLYEKMKPIIVKATNSVHAGTTQDFIFSNPIFSNTAFYQLSGIGKRTLIRLLKELEQQRIVEISKPGTTRIPTLYEFRPLLRIVNR